MMQPMQTQPKSPQVKVLPWSPSSLKAFETCPRRFYLTRTKQATEPQTAATLEGNRVHKVMENALKGTEGLPPAYRNYQPIIDRLHAMSGTKTAERNFALTKSFKPTGYWEKDAWVRGKIDVSIVTPNVAWFLDYKTGKVKDDEDQAKIYAGVAFAEYPHVSTVMTGYVWLGHDSVTTRRFDRGDTPVIWQEFVHRTSRMEHALNKDDWPPRPSGLCREWCPVGKKLCEHCGS